MIHLFCSYLLPPYELAFMHIPNSYTVPFIPQIWGLDKKKWRHEWKLMLSKLCWFLTCAECAETKEAPCNTYNSIVMQSIKRHLWDISLYKKVKKKHTENRDNIWRIVDNNCVKDVLILKGGVSISGKTTVDIWSQQPNKYTPPFSAPLEAKPTKFMERQLPRWERQTAHQHILPN